MAKSALRLTALLLSLALTSFPQEIALEAFPAQMRNAISDAVLYRLFLEHAAAFESQARLNEARGKTGKALRNHLRNQFGLTAEELPGIAQIALDFNDQLSQLRSQQQTIAIRFRADAFPNQANIAVQSLPSLPPALLEIESQIAAISLTARDQLKFALGYSRFAAFDSTLRQRDSFHKGFPESIKRSPGKMALSGTYAYSSIDFDPATRQVTAYAETEMDGTLLPYYEPALHVRINGETHHHDYASSCRKPSPTALVCQFTAKASAYIIFTEHSVRLMVQDPSSKQWIDPVGYELLASFDLAEPFEMQLIGEGSPQSIPERSIILANTFVWSNW